MSGSIGIVNNGMITQNYDAINRFDKVYAGKELSSLSTGTVRAISAEELKAENERKKSEPRVLNVDSSEIINNVFSKTGNNVTYDIGGVSFSNEEMKACKEVVKNALSFLPTMGSDLDYSDYASMGIASNMVSSYVRDNLTKEQAEIVNKSFETYLNDMVHAEKERHNRDGIYMSNSSLEGINKETNSYYYLRTRNNETGFDSLQNLFNDRMSQNVKDTILKNASHVKEYGSVVQSASNEDAAKSIMDLFKNLDMDDKTAVSAAFSQYREKMTPIYRSYGLMNTSNNPSLSNVINRDVERLDIQVSKARNIIKNVGNSCNYLICF